MAEHDDLDNQILVVTLTEAKQFEDSNEGEVEKRQGHGPASSPGVVSGKSRSRHPDDIFGIHRMQRLNVTVPFRITPSRIVSWGPTRPLPSGRGGWVNSIRRVR